MDGSLLGFGIGIILASFHICGVTLVLRARFSVCVRNCIASGPRCFRCRMFM